MKKGTQLVLRELVTELLKACGLRPKKIKFRNRVQQASERLPVPSVTSASAHISGAFE